MKTRCLSRLTDWVQAARKESAKHPVQILAGLIALCAVVTIICICTAGPGPERFATAVPRDWMAELASEELPSGEELVRDADFTEGHAIVSWRNDGSDPETALRAHTGLTDLRVVTADKLLDGDYLMLDVTGGEADTAALLDLLNGCPGVVSAEPDYILHTTSLSDDPFSDLLWGLDNQGQMGFTSDVDINPDKEWGKPDSGDEVVLALIDIGTNWLHEDLVNRMWVNSLEIPGNGIDDDGNGIIDDIHGADLTTEQPGGDPMAKPLADHGTHTAGIMVAEANNDLGIAGVAGSCDNVKLMALEIGNAEGMSYGAAIRSYQYIYEMMTRKTDPVNIVAINDSWGGSTMGIPYLLETMINKVGELGAISVIATGNESRDYSKPVDSDYVADRLGPTAGVSGDWAEISDHEACQDYYAPSISDVESEYIIRVAASDGNGSLTPFSNKGWMYADIAAPGTAILSTVSEPAFLPQTYSIEKINELCATFMTDQFGFRVNSADPYGTNSHITIENNVKNGTAYTNLNGDCSISVNITIKDARADSPYLIELPYTARGLICEQEPILSYCANLLEYPDWVETRYAAPIIRIQDAPADEPAFSLPRILNFEMDWFDEDGNWDSIPHIGDILRPDVWNQSRFRIDIDRSPDRIFRLYVLPSSDGDLKFSIDNFCLTKGIAGEEEAFGQYDYMNGTSMAAPMVTGTLGLLVAKDPTLDTPQKRKEAVLNHTRQVPALNRVVSRCALLDLNAWQDYYAIPQIHEVAYDNGTVTITGESLGNVKSVKVENAPVTPVSVSDTEIVLHYTAPEMRKYSVRVTAPAGWSAADFTGHSGTAYSTTADDYEELLSFADYNFATDGTSVYTFGYTDGTLTRWIPDPADPIHMKKVESFPFDTSEIGDGYYADDPYYLTDLTSFPTPPVDSFFWDNGHLYFTVNLLTCYEVEGYFSQIQHSLVTETSQLVDYDLSAHTTTVYELPEGLFEPAVTIENGEFMLVGGYDRNTKQLSTACYAGDGTTWRKIASLPSARAFGKLTHAAGKLYYTAGADESSTKTSAKVPTILVWDGAQWSDTGVRLSFTHSNSRNIDLLSYTYFQCGVSPLRDGLLFTDRVFTLDNGSGAGIPLGDTVRFDAETLQVSAYPVYYHEMDESHVRGLIVGDTWHGTSIDAMEDMIESTEDYTPRSYYSGILEYYLNRPVMTGRDRSFPIDPDDVPLGDTDLRIVLKAEDGNVSGFTFRVLKGNDEVARVTTGKDGTAYTPKLPAGVYTVMEMPDSTGKYLIPDPQTVLLGLKPVTTVTFTNRLTLPGTGDTADPLLWISMLVVALAAAGVLLFNWIKKRKH